MKYTMAPVALVPNTFSKSAFEYAQSMQPILNELVGTCCPMRISYEQPKSLRYKFLFMGPVNCSFATSLILLLFLLFVLPIYHIHPRSTYLCGVTIYNSVMCSTQNQNHYYLLNIITILDLTITNSHYFFIIILFVQTDTSTLSYQM